MLAPPAPVIALYYNQINSIARSNPIYADAVARRRQLLDETGIILHLPTAQLRLQAGDDRGKARPGAVKFISRRVFYDDFNTTSTNTEVPLAFGTIRGKLSAGGRTIKGSTMGGMAFSEADERGQNCLQEDLRAQWRARRHPARP